MLGFRTAGRRKAHDLSLWRYEHLRVLLQCEGGTDALRGVAQAMIDGAVPPSALGHLGMASLSPLAKPDGGIRPLAVGEVLRRLAARAVCHQCQEAFRKDLAPHQFAVAVGAGCETIHKSVSALAELDADLVVSAVDVTNAFNSILRARCLAAVRALRPELVRFVELWYGRSSAYLFRDELGARALGAQLRRRSPPPSPLKRTCALKRASLLET